MPGDQQDDTRRCHLACGLAVVHLTLFLGQTGRRLGQVQLSFGPQVHGGGGGGGGLREPVGVPQVAHVGAAGRPGPDVRRWRPIIRQAIRRSSAGCSGGAIWANGRHYAPAGGRHCFRAAVATNERVNLEMLSAHGEPRPGAMIIIGSGGRVRLARAPPDERIIRWKGGRRAKSTRPAARR